jgi:hypothetical protein
MGLILNSVELEKKLNKTNPITIPENKPMNRILNLIMGLSALRIINAHAATNYVGNGGTVWGGSFGACSLRMSLGLAGLLASVGQEGPTKTNFRMRICLLSALALVVALGNPSSSNANTVYALGVGFSVDANTLDAVNAATTFYNLAGTDHAASLPSSLGATINVDQGGSLLLSGATAKTWQSSTDSANSVTLLYRVYETGTVTGSRPGFSSYNILYSNQWQPDANINKYWSSTSTPGTVNLLTGLTAGTIATPKNYTIELYGMAAFTWSSGGSSGSFNSFANNSGNPNNYTTQFQLVPEPSSASLLTFALSGLLALRRRKA